MLRNVIWVLLWLLLVGCVLALEANANDQQHVVVHMKPAQVLPAAADDCSTAIKMKIPLPGLAKSHQQHLRKRRELHRCRYFSRRRHPFDSQNAIRHGPTKTTTIATTTAHTDYKNNHDVGAVQTTDTPLLNAHSYPAASNNGSIAKNRQKKRRLHKQQRQLQVQALKQRSAKAAEGLLLLSDTNNNGHNANADNNYSHNYIPGKLTELKNKQLGNPKAVSNSRRGHNPDSELAEKHYRTVMEEAMCHEPQMRCMRVERDPSKIYRPHCTKLFRCSEDSGCCRSRSEICAPKEYHEVELTFYVSTVGSRKSTTEKLSFVNHTKCHCIERTNFYNGALSNVGELQQAAILNCNCPKLFEKIIQNDGKCRCDCTSSSNHCAYLKTGIEHFSMKDRKCIHQGICKAPTCQYGNYMEKHGRCPNENEQSNYNAHNLS
ncbi:uncharacterized protein LOC133835105 isoform X3 [Drosophila sulfurigaster albostrigata]|uniref:uncharacterized protein LOC133835105 isoform X3 n=1 Tax=Drosophila sulfurigaster albostrigata TaxID=89887 RepID=UPI002D21E72E|nr:uncharacterized protein LOC133835105 isoform X3 [Drosophila sulfurigaster albostrigata]